MTVERALLGTTDANTAANYIEDVFSTYLYTGTGSAQTITNGIDLSTKGGLVWLKGRSGATDHALYDTSRGATYDLVCNSSAGQTTQAQGVTAFGTTGFSVGTLAKVNTNAATYSSWAFRKQAKFFDVVTYTGNGSNRTIAHNLGSVPGCIIVKRTNTTGDWQVYHRSLANTEYLVLNTTAAKATGATRWNSTTPTSSVFSLGTDATVNASGGTYVAYLFAHDAGGFGAAGTDNVISCGSFTTDGSGNATVTLGYEPQYVLAKLISGGTGLSNWFLMDVMRGLPVSSGAGARLNANNADAEDTASITGLLPGATGFSINGPQFQASASYVYIAIRRGPMRTPTLGTSVFSPIASSAGTGTKLTTNFPVDLQIYALRTGTTGKGQTVDRLRGVSANATESGALLATNSSAIEVTTNIPTLFWDNTGFQMPSSFASSSDVFWSFRRSPGFFDAVCYKGTGANTTVTHNLAVAPELILVKSRSSAVNWSVYAASQGASKFMYLNTTLASTTGATFWNSTDPTASVFSVGTSTGTNGGSANYIAYLFATCPGVSKVGSYTGTGTTKQIDCGFTGGARFVMIKRADSAGDWYVWDTARGISASNDPYLLMNSSAAEVTNTDYVDPYAAGFEISSTAPAAINANGGTFIYLAIA